MSPTREKSLLSSFSVGAQSQGNKTSNINSQQCQDTITQCDAVLVPLQRLSASTAKERQQRNNNQNGFSFPPEERVPFSQPRKGDDAHFTTARVPSQRLSARAMGQHNNQKGAIGTKERQQRNNNQNGVFFFS
jgi:hypothetical protein